MDDGWVDLAAARYGGQALLANDEFFAAKENLLAPGRGVFIADKYTERGKWMDGWETRRRRTPGHDWCIIRLGLPGVVHAVTIDTNHFRGNHPAAASIDVCRADTEMPPPALAESDAWQTVLSEQSLIGHTENRFSVTEVGSVNHVRLRIHPDGGVARLRVHGTVVPDWAAVLADPAPIDLLAVAHGGRALDCSDRFFSAPENLIAPGRGADMGDGWETRRRRGPGHDWAVLRLGRRGLVSQVLVDTRHFKGNFPAACSLEGCDAAGVEGVPDDGRRWFRLLDEQPLGAHAEHRFDPLPDRAVTHVRLNIYPDGGISRLRLFGRPAASD